MIQCRFFLSFQLTEPFRFYDLYIYVVVKFLSQVIFVFLLFLSMLMYANEVEIKKK